MNRKVIGTSIVVVGLLAGSFLAGSLAFKGGGSAATATQPPGLTGSIVTPTATPKVVTPTATPKVTITPTVTPEDGDQGNEGGSTSQAGSASGGGTQVGDTGQQSGNGGNNTTDPPTQAPPAITPTLPPADPPTPEPPAPEPPAEEPEELEEPEEPEEPEPPVVNEAPIVLESAPANEETGVALGTTIEVTFSEPMDTGSVEDAFSINPVVSGSFAWDPAGLVMTFTPDADFGYNTKVVWNVDGSAQDEAGLDMGDGYGGSFWVLRQKTMSLYSQAGRDGFVYMPSVPSIDPVITEGFNGHNSLKVGSWYRGFVSFDLAKLPANTIEITAAELVIHQRAHHAQAYTAETGALWAISLPYGDLDASDSATPTPKICPNVCYPLGMELTNSPADGWKNADVTILVRANWNTTEGGVERLSQFRLQFEHENAGMGPDVWAEFHSGEAGGTGPRLEVTFVY